MLYVDGSTNTAKLEAHVNNTILPGEQYIKEEWVSSNYCPSTTIRTIATRNEKIVFLITTAGTVSLYNTTSANAEFNGDASLHWYY